MVGDGCEVCNPAKSLEYAKETIAKQEAEIERLNSCLRYEQHRAERIGTHGPGCETWGPAHYNCAVQAIEKLQHSLADRDEALEKNLGTIVHLSGRLAACREREARMQWQPIETAPKDGTSVLLCKAIDADGKPIEWGRDMQTAQVFVQVAAWWSGDNAWIVYCSQIADPSLHFDPTHWMPLGGLYAALAEGAQA